MANPGKLDRRITVQARTLTKDATGGRVETWADAFDCWAEDVRQSQREAITAESDRAVTTRQFRVRYNSSIAAGTHRILYQLKFYNIIGIAEEGRKHMLLLDCQSVQSLTNV